jgi:inner membrane protein
VHERAVIAGLRGASTHERAVIAGLRGTSTRERAVIVGLRGTSTRERAVIVGLRGTSTRERDALVYDQGRFVGALAVACLTPLGYTPAVIWLTWEIWGVAALVLLGGELLSLNFVLVWPAISALAVAVGAYLGLSTEGQLALFSVSSVVLLALSRTLFKRWLFPDKRSTLTNTDAMPGTQVQVLETVAGAANPGTVRYAGEVWTAFTEDGRTLSPGQAAVVVRVEGLKLCVRALEPETNKVEREWS